MESLDSIVDELIWRIEGGFHNKWDGFAVAHTPRINQEVRDVLAHNYVYEFEIYELHYLGNVFFLNTNVILFLMCFFLK